MERKKFTTTLDSDLIKQLKIIAVKKEISVSALIEQIAKPYLENRSRKIH
ncbi:hypothetical protein ABTQ33_01660 [Paucilactobacillus suebicus]|nr:hypothetical protein [Paucilactobacillus suebicus]